MVFNLDVRFEEALARDTSLPGSCRPDAGAGESNGVQKRLTSLRPESRYALAAKRAKVMLPNLGARRDSWTPGLVQHSGRPAPDAASLRGHVVLIDF